MVGNPEDRFSHNEAHIRNLGQCLIDILLADYLHLQYWIEVIIEESLIKHH